jgi:hypothetical protein
MVRAEDSLSVGQQVVVHLLRVLVLAARRDLQPISYLWSSITGSGLDGLAGPGIIPE